MALSQSGVTIPAQGTGDSTPVVAADPAGPGGSYAQTVDLVARVVNYLEILASALGLSQDASTGRLRILLDAITASLTLATVTTVSTVSTVSNLPAIGNLNTNSTVADLIQLCWAESVRANIT